MGVRGRQTYPNRERERERGDRIRETREGGEREKM